MAMTPQRSRVLLIVCTALLVVVALLVAVGVIPGVSASEAPNITPETAVPAFWVSVGLHLAAALALALTAALSKGRSGVSTSVLVVTGIATLLFGFVLGDAALAFREAGPSMQTVTMLLVACVVADVVAGALTITTAFLRPGDTSNRRR